MTLEVWQVPVPMRGKSGNWVFNVATKIYTAPDGESRAETEEWMKQRAARDVYCPKFCTFEIREAPPDNGWDL